MVSLEEEIEIVNPLRWARELNETFREIGMPSGYEVLCEVEQERSINYGLEKSLTAHYTVKHPELRRVRTAFTEFRKDKGDPDSLEQIAKDYVTPMSKIINAGLREGGDNNAAKYALQNR